MSFTDTYSVCTGLCTERMFSHSSDVELYGWSKSPGYPHHPPASQPKSFPKKKISHRAELDVLFENPSYKQFPTRCLFLSVHLSVYCMFICMYNVHLSIGTSVSILYVHLYVQCTSFYRYICQYIACSFVCTMYIFLSVHLSIYCMFICMYNVHIITIFNWRKKQ